MCMNESALSVKYLIWIRGGLYYHPGANNGQSKGKAGQEQQLVSNLKLPLIGKGTFHPGWFLPTIQISEEVLDLKKFGLLKVLLVFPESSKTHLILPNSIVTWTMVGAVANFKYCASHCSFICICRKYTCASQICMIHGKHFMAWPSPTL